jgi:hypothetical protein
MRRMTADPIEILLARLLANPSEVAEFLLDREIYARRCGVGAAQLTAVLEIDAIALQFAANSYQRKRQSVSRR